jgi:hypothetical protein
MRALNAWIYFRAVYFHAERDVSQRKLLKRLENVVVLSVLVWFNHPFNKD